MQQKVAFASEAKQRLIPTLEVFKNFHPGGQIDKSSGNQIVCYFRRKAKLRWVVFKNLVAMSRA